MCHLIISDFHMIIGAFHTIKGSFCIIICSICIIKGSFCITTSHIIKFIYFKIIPVHIIKGAICNIGVI